MTTALVYNEVNLRHTLEGHPEHAGRLRSTMDLLARTGLLDALRVMPGRQVAMEDLERVHSPVMIERLRRTADAERMTWLDADTYANPHSFTAALTAAGGVVELTAALLRGEIRNGMSLGRPPGHHATPSQAMGFCLLNHVAIAVRWALAQTGVRKAAIVDFDVHHGNGTQDIFYQDPAVLFLSLHQSPHYPMTGYAGETGLGPGRGTTRNAPLPPGTGDSGYAEVVERIFRPLLREFEPELMMVSAGYDGHWMDPLSDMNLTLGGYADLVRSLMEISEEVCGGRLVLVLEGGYHLDVLAHGVHNSLRVLSDTGDILDPFGASGQADRDIHPALADLMADPGYASLNPRSDLSP